VNAWRRVSSQGVGEAGDGGVLEHVGDAKRATKERAEARHHLRDVERVSAGRKEVVVDRLDDVAETTKKTRSSAS
jgi:hypothetical protein